MPPESIDCILQAVLKGIMRVLKHNLTIEKQEFYLDLQLNLMRAPLWNR